MKFIWRYYQPANACYIYVEIEPYIKAHHKGTVTWMLPWELKLCPYAELESKGRGSGTKSDILDHQMGFGGKATNRTLENTAHT